MNDRDLYLKRFQDLIDTVQKEANALQARANSVGAEMKPHVDEAISRLKAAEGDMQRQLDALRTSGTENWEKMKPHVDEAFGRLKSAESDMHRQLETLRTTGIENWESIRGKLDAATQDVLDGVRKAVDRFR